MQHSDPTVNSKLVSSLFIRSANIRICESTYRLFAFFFFLDLRLALGLVARLSFMLKYQLYNMTEICAYSQYGGGNSFCVCVGVSSGGTGIGVLMRTRYEAVCSTWLI